MSVFSSWETGVVEDADAEELLRWLENELVSLSEGHKK